MQTIRLRIHDKVYKNLMWLLNRFSKEEIQIIEENEQFVSIQEYLKDELEKIESGKGEFIDLDQLDNDLEGTIRKHEA